MDKPPVHAGRSVFRRMYIRRDEAASADGGVAGMILMLMAIPNRAQWRAFFRSGDKVDDG